MTAWEFAMYARTKAIKKFYSPQTNKAMKKKHIIRYRSDPDPKKEASDETTEVQENEQPVTNEKEFAQNYAEGGE